MLRNKKKEVKMSEKQEQVLEIFKNLAPKEFGIKKSYYTIDGNKVELTFFVDEKFAPSLIGYLRALGNLLESKLDDIEISSNIYIYQNKGKVEEVAKEAKWKSNEPSKELGFACS